MALPVQVTVCGVVCVLQYCKGGVVCACTGACWGFCLLAAFDLVAIYGRYASWGCTDSHTFAWAALVYCFFVNYRVFLVQKCRATSNIQDAAPAGTTSGVYDIDKFFKEELQTILISVYRVIEWWSWKAIRRLRSCASDARGSWWRIVCTLSAKGKNAWSWTSPPPYTSSRRSAWLDKFSSI
jgi:hypothetical protein